MPDRAAMNQRRGARPRLFRDEAVAARQIFPDLHPGDAGFIQPVFRTASFRIGVIEKPARAHVLAVGHGDLGEVFVPIQGRRQIGFLLVRGAVAVGVVSQLAGIVR